MRTLRPSLAGTVMLVLPVGSGVAVSAHSEETDASAFPIGTFVATDGHHESVEFKALVKAHVVCLSTEPSTTITSASKGKKRK